MRGKVDLLLFNPPYVLTPSEEVATGGIAAAVGGREGRAGGPRRLLPDVADVLAPGGTFLLLLLHDNKPHDVAEILASSGLETDRD